MATQQQRADALVARHGRTFAEQAGIRLKDTPSPLYRLLVLAALLSARISGDIAVAAARELSAAGFRTAQRMADSSWQQRVDALGRGGYRRYDERTSTMLGDGAVLLLERYRGDLRRLRDEAADTEEIRQRLQEFPGIGPAGADIFCREAQGVWPGLRPYLDDKVLQGAERVGLPGSATRLARLVDPGGLPALAAGCVRAARDDDVAADARQTAG